MKEKDKESRDSKEKGIRVVVREEIEEREEREDRNKDRDGDDEIEEINIHDLTEIEEIEKDKENKKVETKDIPPLVSPISPVISPVRITKDVMKEAEELAENKKLPTLPVQKGRLTDFQTMISWLDLLTEEQFKRIVIYMYRHHPVIDRKLSDPKNYNYIDCISHKVTLKDIQKRHGGGKYGFHITDVEGENHKKNLFQAKLDINMMEYDPILDYREIDFSSRDNISYIQGLRARNIIDGDNKAMAGMVGDGRNNSSNSNIEDLKQLINITKSLTNEQQQQVKNQVGINDSKPLADILIAKLNNENKDSTNMVSMMGTMMTAMLSVLKEGNKPPPVIQAHDSGAQLMQFMQLMLTQIQSSTTSQMEMMKLMMQEKKGNADPFEQIEKIIMLTDRLKGGGATAERDTVDKVMDGIERIGLPIFDNVIKMFALAKGSTGLPSATGNNQQQIGNKIIPGQPVAKQVTAGGNATSNIYKEGTQTRNLEMEMPPENNPKPNGAIVGNNQSQNNTQQNTQTQTQVNENEQALQALVASLQGPQGAIVLQAMNTGKKGYEFAEWLIEGYGVQTWTLITQYGEENVVRAMMSIQQFAGFGQDFVSLWVNNFFHYEEALAMLEDEGEDEIEEIDNEITELPVSTVTGKSIKKSKKTVQ